MKIIKLAGLHDKIEDDIRDIKKDVKDINRDIKDHKKDIEKINKELSEINNGYRLVAQNRDIFHSLQRKIERFEKMEMEWKEFKDKEKSKEVESKR